MLFTELLLLRLLLLLPLLPWRALCCDDETEFKHAEQHVPLFLFQNLPSGSATTTATAEEASSSPFHFSRETKGSKQY